MSRLFASILIRSRRDSGSLREMVLVEGFRFGNCARLACFQSTYSVESWLSQKARSSLSFLNSGIFLALLINLPLLTVHITGGNHSDQTSSASQGKCNV